MTTPLEFMMMRPTQGARIDPQSNEFGDVRVGSNGKAKAHYGWDLFARIGTPARAIANGTLTYRNDPGGYGEQLILKFGYLGTTYYAQYAHLSKEISKASVQVSEGEIIGYTGNSGNAKSKHLGDMHLHFEIRYKDPVPKGSKFEFRKDPQEILGRYPFLHSKDNATEIFFKAVDFLSQ
ncbi:M23 family metallopeptidase [Runella sp. MFBS21]|uniref:M23 family metallopeptidase n=1 Tax=Runella sp. MFBS21 TaxID=3034018 RepID=UPI0023F71527|nr:M23 family metallopeptidase [Runella sp. MFBS21]MDF7820501.1 M23 family metallopeptidase [Runella sp. MFBS21]